MASIKTKTTFFSYALFEQRKPERKISWYSKKKRKLFRPEKWSTKKLEKIDIL